MPQGTNYEKKQLKEIEAWKQEEPGIISRGLGKVLAPVASLVQMVVPAAAIEGALDLAQTAGKWLADREDLLAKANVERIEDLNSGKLEVCDGLADAVHDWAVALAAAEGEVAGFFGILSAPVDIPALITIALRTIHKVALCYGYECDTEQDKQFVLGILAASGANSQQEKLAALATLKTLEVMIAKQTWTKLSEAAAKKQLSKEGAIIGLRNLARQLGVNLTKGKALASIPAIRALIGASVNGWYVKDVGWAARRMFQERWLRDNGKLIDVESAA